MISFLLASNNPNKLREFREILEKDGIRIISLKEAGVRSDPEETGTTFRENAFIKARAACKKTGLPALADDSGIAVEALSGAPGVYSARFGGLNDEGEQRRLLLKMMEGKTDRRAAFVACIACVFPNGDELWAQDDCRGVLTLEERGNGGFGYDPIFQPDGFSQTTAEMSPEEKNAISHRGKALRKMESILSEYLKEKGKHA